MFNYVLPREFLKRDQMDTVKIHEAVTDEQILSCYPVMQQLRPHLVDPNGFLEQVKRQKAQGYRLVYCKKDGEVRALIGFRRLEFLAKGQICYVDDLITDATARGAGLGRRLMDRVIEFARMEKCDQIVLDSGPQRHEAHRFYLNAKFQIIGHHFSLVLDQ
jgi:GNAT superfamily N-acetyltransferase